MTPEERLKHLARVARSFGLTVWQWKPGPVGHHAPNSFHNQTFHDGVGKAFDVYGSLPRMMRFRRYIRSHHPYLTEGIWNAPGPLALSVARGKRVPSSYWGSDTWQAHKGHMHIAIA